MMKPATKVLANHLKKKTKKMERTPMTNLKRKTLKAVLTTLTEKMKKMEKMEKTMAKAIVNHLIQTINPESRKPGKKKARQNPLDPTTQISNGNLATKTRSTSWKKTDCFLLPTKDSKQL